MGQKRRKSRGKNSYSSTYFEKTPLSAINLLKNQINYIQNITL